MWPSYSPVSTTLIFLIFHCVPKYSCMSFSLTLLFLTDHITIFLCMFRPSLATLYDNIVRKVIHTLLDLIKQSFTPSFLTWVLKILSNICNTIDKLNHLTCYQAFSIVLPIDFSNTHFINMLLKRFRLAKSCN